MGIAPPPGISPGIPLPPFGPRPVQQAPAPAPKLSAAQQTIKVEMGEEIEQHRSSARRNAVLAAIAGGQMLWTIDAQPYLMGYVPVMMFDLLKRYKLRPVVADGLYATGPSFVEKADAIALQSLAPGVR